MNIINSIGFFAIMVWLTVTIFLILYIRHASARPKKRDKEHLQSADGDSTAESRKVIVELSSPTPEAYAQAQVRARVAIKSQLQSELNHIDEMTGSEFENYVAGLLSHKGYSTTVTRASADYGIDIVAEFKGQRYGIQVKRHIHKVARTAISDAVAGLAFYSCNRSMVITNSYFQQGAKELALVNNCELVDRDKLAYWMECRLADYAGLSVLNEQDNLGAQLLTTKPLASPQHSEIIITQEQPGSRNYVYSLLHNYLVEGKQGFIIYPLCWPSSFALFALEQISSKLAGFQIRLIDEYTSYEEIEQIENDFKSGTVHVIMCHSTTPRIESKPTIRIIIMEDAEELTLSELYKFSSILLDKPGKKHFVLVSYFDGLLDSFNRTYAES